MSSDRLERKRRSEFDDSDDSADDQPPAKITKTGNSSHLGNFFTDKLKDFFSWLTPTTVKNYMTNFVKSSFNRTASTLNMGLGDGMRNNSIEEDDEDEIGVIAVQNGVPAAFHQKVDQRSNVYSQNSTWDDSNICPLSTPVAYPEHMNRSKATYVERRQMNGYVNMGVSQQPTREKGNSYSPITNPSSDLEILLEKKTSDDKDIEIITEIPAPLNRKNKYSSFMNGARLDKMKYFENLIEGTSSRSRKSQKLTALELLRLKERAEYAILLRKQLQQNVYVPSVKRSIQAPLIQVDLTKDEDEEENVLFKLKKEKFEGLSDFVTRYCKPCALVPRAASKSESQIPSTSADADSDDDVQLISDLPKFTPRKKTTNGSLFSKAWIEELKTTIEIDKRKHLQMIAEQNEKLERYKKRRDAKLALEKRRRDELQLAGVILPEEVDMEEETLPEITPEMARIIKAALGPGDPGERFSTIDRLSLTRNDMATLSGLNWLNDQVINFYLALISERSKLDNYPSVYTCNSFFYTSIKTRGSSGVLRWTRKIDIFSYDLILVPLHLGMHWALIAVDNRIKKIKYYDSMGCSEERSLRLINEYLVCEMMDKQKKVLDPYAYSQEIATDIPKQMNGSDCGMFTLKYAEYISRDAPITFTQKHMPYFRQRMVYELLTKQIL